MIKKKPFGELTPNAVESAGNGDPKRLLQFVQKNQTSLSAYELANAVEVLGRLKSAFSLLESLSSHNDSAVRGGVVMGLMDYPDQAKARSLLLRILAVETCESIRVCIADSLNK